MFVVQLAPLCELDVNTIRDPTRLWNQVTVIAAKLHFTFPTHNITNGLRKQKCVARSDLNIQN